MQALGVSVLKKHLRVCSDHFDANSFHDTGGYTTIRRLQSNAVPSIITNTKVILLLSNPVTQYQKKFLQSINSNENVVEVIKFHRS